MRPPCEIVVRYVLPTFRSLVAKKLIEEYDFTQVAAAKKLGTTQAAISHYIYSKRGEKRAKQLESDPTIQAITNEVSKGIAEDRLSPVDALLRFCKLCIALRTRGVICSIHRDFINLPEACRACGGAIRVEE